MRHLYSCLVVFVLIFHVYGIPKWGLPSKKPAVYRPTYCLTLPFNSNCKPLTPHWYYDINQKICIPISAEYRVEGLNKFVSLKKCSETCHSRTKIILKECRTPPKITVGGVLKYAWYFDEQTKLCKMFTFSTCNNSNGNYFASELKCQSVCLPKMKPTPRCSADPIRDVCLIQRKHYFFSFRNNTCMQFSKKGCGKGINSFASMVKCMDMCSYNQSTMVCSNCEQKHPNELPPKGKPTGPHILGPVSNRLQIGPPVPPSPPTTQGTHSPTAPNRIPVLPTTPNQQSKPSSTLPGSPVRPTSPTSMSAGIPVPSGTPTIHGTHPTPPTQSIQSIPPGIPIPSGTPTAQSTPTSAAPGSPVLPTPPLKHSQPVPTGKPLPPTAPTLQGKAGSPVPPGNANQPWSTWSNKPTS
ncbi:hypothetical protein MTO96_026353 [Rhipicephalus appendiculatus]